MQRIKDFFLGNEGERVAQKTVQELAGTNLNAGRRDRLRRAQGLSRRLFIRQALTLATFGLVAAGAGSQAPKYLEAYANEQEEVSFWKDLEVLPTSQKMVKVEEFYAKRYLTREIAEKKVLPIFVQHVITQHNSDKDPDQVLSRTKLESDRPKAKGSTQFDPHTETMGNIVINFNQTPSNQLVKQGSIFIPGIQLFRNIFSHEFGHFDTAFKDITRLVEVLKANSFFKNVMPNIAKGVAVGFEVFLIAPDKFTQIHFHDFNEAANDVRNIYANSRAGLSTIIGYPKAFYLKEFLDWIGYDGEHYINLHRNSDIEQFARDLGKKSLDNKKQPSDSNSELLRGFQVISALEGDNQEFLEDAFPGVKAQIFSKPIKLIYN